MEVAHRFILDGTTRLEVFHQDALIHDYHPIHQHVSDSSGVLRGILIGSTIDDGVGVKEGEVGIGAHLHPPLAFHHRGSFLETLRRQ